MGYYDEKILYNHALARELLNLELSASCLSRWHEDHEDRQNEKIRPVQLIILNPEASTRKHKTSQENWRERREYYESISKEMMSNNVKNIKRQFVEETKNTKEQLKRIIIE